MAVLAMVACALGVLVAPLPAAAQLPQPPSLPSPPTLPVTTPTLPATPTQPPISSTTPNLSPTPTPTPNPPPTPTPDPSPPAVTVPSVSAPSVTTPSLGTAPSVTTPSVTTPSVSTSTVTSPSGSGAGSGSGSVDPTHVVSSVTGTLTRNTGGGGGPAGGGTGNPTGSLTGTVGKITGGTTKLNTTAAVPRAPGVTGGGTPPTGAGSRGSGGGPASVLTNPLGSLLGGNPLVGVSSPQPLDPLASGLVGPDPQIGVLGVASLLGGGSTFASFDSGGALTPAGLVAQVNGPTGGAGGGSGGSHRDVIEQVGHAISTIVQGLPDWSRPIIGALLVLLLLFAAHSWRTGRRARKASMQNAVMQAALVPELPEAIAGLAVSGGYRPADEVAQGGDFYDIFALDDHRAAIILGDVSGHDLHALGRSNAVRHKLRTLVEEGFDEGWELRRVLEKASKALSKQWLDGDFVTAAVAIHDAEAGTLTYACAGHPAPILTGDAAHDPVSVCSSPALGWGLPTGRRQTTVSFGAGETACFYTDGLTEARVKGEFLGRDGLARLVDGLGAAGDAKALLNAVIGLSHEADDDLAALVVRSDSAAPSAFVRLEELEIDADDVRRKAPERFLAACDAPADVIERLGAVARVATEGSRRAVLRAMFSRDGTLDATIAPVASPATREPERAPALLV